RIRRRMALRKFSDVEDYVRYVKETPKEAEDLSRDILITVTHFFRDPDAFEALKKTAIHPLLTGRDPRSDLRMWVPGCATGEEAYSIAMAVAESLSSVSSTAGKMPVTSVHIFATDVNEASLAKARLGIYSEAVVKDLTPDRLGRFFVKQGGMYHVQKSIRQICVFSRQNVAKDPPFSNLDLISCRNLLIYFGEALQRRVVPAFHYALRPGGYLILGGSETLGKFADQFAVVDKKYKIYQKKSDSPRLLTYFMNAAATPPEATAASRSPAPSSTQSLERQFDRALLEAFGPASIVVTEQMEIVHLRGNTGEYLQPPSGQPSFNLNKVARDGLLLDLRLAIKAAKKSGKVERRENLEIQSDHGPIRAAIEVRHFTPAGSRERHYIIAFQDASTPVRKLKPPAAGSQGGRNGQQRENANLRQELAHAKEQIKALIEDYETSQEEYRSSNEEVLSSNEELQSLNEEMETAREELQSTNEELRTVNEELQNRNNELLSVNDDLSNLFSNVSIPIIMVSNDLLIRRFTPQAEPLLNLAPEDAGRRHISELRPNLRDVDLAEIARRAISSVGPREEEIRANDGTWYLMRVRAYKTKERHVEGAVLAFQDIDLLKRSLDESRSYSATLTESARESILVLDSSLRVISANNSFYRKFLVDPVETEGRLLYELGAGQWNIPRLRSLLEDILPSHLRIDDFEVRADFPQLGAKVMHLNARRIESQTGRKVILLAVEDVTELKHSEEAVRALSSRLLNLEDEQRRRIARDLHDVTGQNVAALSLNVRLLAKQIPNARNNQTFKDTLELAERITNEIRGLSYTLHPPMLDELGLAPALREYVEGVSERTGLRIELSVHEQFPHLPDEIAITIFRIIQECLANVRRHSGSSEARIDVRHNGTEIELRVADSGSGAKHGTDDSGPADGPKEKMGVGIAGMRERVSYLGGTLEVLSGASGTTVIARIPIPESHDCHN
ncbi:MAG: CheR family methyltransferase, partial [Terriglobia bacterium]